MSESAHMGLSLHPVPPSNTTHHAITLCISTNLGHSVNIVSLPPY